MMKKFILIMVAVWCPLSAVSVRASNAEEVQLEHAAVDISNTVSLQRGARLFVNYCLSCHSARYSRYSRVGEDLGLTTKQVEDNLIFTDRKIHDQMKVAMSAKEEKGWFGTQAPDLSLVARARGADWVYSYLRSFYLDDSRPFGVNNLVLPNAAMPDVLWELQGWQKLVQKDGKKEGEEMKGNDQAVEELEIVKPGKLTPKEYDRAVLDLTNFLVYLSEPAQLKRKQLGLWVVLFLVFFFVVAYALKKEYWKDVH
jgi:ubiquinol-cytochrome c reductase cytochrome c1 subunit